MVWEFPAVSQSRIEFWGTPQFTQSGMWWFTLIFGFFGLHHLYLRSPQTALIFFIVNCITCGYPWFYDLIQLSKSGGYTLETLNKHGLAHAFGALGLAQGMWKDSKFGFFSSAASAASATASATASLPPGLGASASLAPVAAAASEAAAAAAQTAAAAAHALPIQSGGAADDAPNPTWFLLYAILLPIAPLAQLIAGDNYNSISRFLDLTIIPLGFLFYICALFYDYFILLLYPADLFVAGSKRFFPFTQLGMHPDGHSERLTGLSEITPCPPDGFITTFVRIILPFLSYFFPGLGATVTGALDTVKQVKTTVVDTASDAVQTAQVISSIAKPPGLGSLAPIPLPLPQIPQVPMPQMPQIPQVPMPQVPMPRVMVGGGRDKSLTFNTLDYVALGSLGAVIGGGFLLSLNRSKNDPPPNPRGI